MGHRWTASTCSSFSICWLISSSIATSITIILEHLMPGIICLCSLNREVFIIFIISNFNFESWFLFSFLFLCFNQQIWKVLQQLHLIHPILNQLHFYFRLTHLHLWYYFLRYFLHSYKMFYYYSRWFLHQIRL